MSEDLDEAALRYHRSKVPGKLEVVATKPLTTQRDLSLAYSPGVAAACNLIVDDPATVVEVTARGNLVAVITNGTAVLGLGNIGPLASKPVMEGKAVLFKKFSNIDVFDIEIDQPDTDKFIEAVAALEPTFGGINLEDLKAPECFEIEKALRKRMGIPVFHDDQHGTAIIVTAAIVNGLRVVGKDISAIRLVTSGAGAAALACLNQLVKAGLKKENIIVTDIEGVVYQGRKEQMDPWKSVFAVDTEARTLDDVIGDADVFLGLSAPGVLKPEMVKRMAEKPLILALANPTPEILPELAREARDDAIIATGRSDYPNQVNNVLCFPFIFRGALDVGATTINDEMKLACVHALANLAMKESSDRVLRAYGGEPVKFGPEYLIPRPFDPRLIFEIAPAVAQAAMDSGVATRPIENMPAYRGRLEQFVYQSGFVMKPIFERAKENPKRIVYAEGEDVRVLHTAQELIDEGIAYPVLIGREQVILEQVNTFGLRMQAGEDFDIVDPQSDEHYEEHCKEYHRVMGRKGVTPGGAEYLVRTQNTLVAALMVRLGEADAMICGVIGGFRRNLLQLMDIIGKGKGICEASTVVAHILPNQTLFICDAHVTPNPTAEELVEMTLLCADEVRFFGIEPKIALLSHSNFGASFQEQALKMRAAVNMLHERAPDLEVEGEMHADAALSEKIRSRMFPDSKLKGSANLLVMPNVDAANISVNMLKILGGGVTVGPILVGMAKPVHVVAQATTVRSLVNMSALSVVHAQQLESS